jgi:hypothetical protein
MGVQDPAPFTADDYAARMARAARAAREAGLAGVLVAPGPDLAWLTGYQPTAITERLTLLVLAQGHGPTLLLPTLERPDALAAPGAPALTTVDWTDGDDPYAAAARLLSPDGRYGVSDSAWALHLLGLQRALPGTGYRALTDCLPMLRAVKDEHELARLAAAGAAADAPTRTSSASGSPAGGRPTSPATSPTCCASTATRRSTSPWSVRAPTAPTRTMRPATRRSRSATPWCSTSAA